MADSRHCAAALHALFDEGRGRGARSSARSNYDQHGRRFEAYGLDHYRESWRRWLDEHDGDQDAALGALLDAAGVA